MDLSLHLPSLEAELFLYDGAGANPIRLAAEIECPFLSKVNYCYLSKVDESSPCVQYRYRIQACRANPERKLCKLLTQSQDTAFSFCFSKDDDSTLVENW